MGRLVRCLALAALAAGVLATPARATEGDIVLSGSTTAWVDIEIPGRQNVPMNAERISTGGRFGGFYAEQLTSTFDPSYAGRTSGVVNIRALDAADGPSALQFGHSSVLSTGVIRLYLIADGPTRVTIRTGLPRTALTLRPRNRVAAHVAATPLRRTGDAWVASAGIAVPKRSAAVAALVAEGTLPGTGDPELCIVERGGPCPRPTLGVVGERLEAGPLAPASRWHISYLPGRLRAGRQQAQFALAETTGLATVTGAAFTLTLA